MAKRWKTLVASLAVATIGNSVAVRGQAGDAPRVRFELHWGVTGSESASIDLAGLPIRRDIVIFYEHSFGKYPRAWDGRPENGGTPHRADLAGHLEKVRQDVQRAIPQPGWSGYAVIDFESWHPDWELCPPGFQEFAVKQTRAESPWMDAAGALRMAKARHESAGRKFVLQTIEVCKAMRPSARWGFFNLPADGHQALADATPWLWEAQTAFFPVVSVDKQGIESGTPKPGQANVAEYRAHVRRAVDAAKRFAGDKPIIAIGWLRYPEFNEVFSLQFLAELDLRELLQETERSGADGLILWDDVSKPELALRYTGYLRTIVRPMLERLGVR